MLSWIWLAYFGGLVSGLGIAILIKDIINYRKMKVNGEENGV